MGNEYIQNYSRERTLIKIRIDTAKREGKTEEKIEIAKMFLKNTKVSLEDIIKCTGLPKEKLEKLKEN